MVEEIKHSMVDVVLVLRRHRGPRRVDTINIEPLASEQPVQDANSQRRLLAVQPSPAQAHPSPCAFGSDVGARADRSGGVRIEVLTTSLIDVIVVATQEPCDDRTNALGPVAKWLMGEHRRQLHHARTVLGVPVAAGAELDRLIAL